MGMIIKSENASNPVLLFVHGGPGMPEYWLTETYHTGLREIFYGSMVGSAWLRFIL